MSAVLVRLVRRRGGEASVASLLAQAGSTHDATYLEDIEHWISLDEACALLEAGAEVTGEHDFARQVGAEMLRQHAGTQVATMMRSLGSPEAIYQAVAQASSNVSTVSDLTSLETEPGRALVSAVARDGFTRRRAHCDWTTGLLSGPPMLFGLPPADVQELECQARGDARCLYSIDWDATLAQADPQERITAMEAQLVAMSQRLQSAYATAGDLISTEELGAVLQRIVERAADAVRAPGYILAVRTEADAELRVFSHGLELAEASRLAARSRPDTAGTEESVLVVDVASARRKYGTLSARYPTAIQFSSQEREMLSLYAKHAAAVLDMATALDESARRHAQVSSLLSLSHAVAQAGTTEEVAERLAAAVPEVVSCDGMAVWLWDDEAKRLGSIAAWSREPERTARLRDMSIDTSDTPLLERMRSTQQPLFFERGTDDGFVAALMEELDLVRLAVVPIVTRNTFRGALSVSVTARPERLRPTSELLERLTGVAALAAPAMENGRLVDKLHHRASHDGLTGLLNRVGFRHIIDATLARAEGRQQPFGLLFVDLNDFKQVNDRHGHEAGDELIRQTARRLRSICRGNDQVARLGGDEFAIVIAPVGSASQLHAAEQRVRAAFSETFELVDATVSLSASVGGAIWPIDGASMSELLSRSDAAMYTDKTRSRSSLGVVQASARTPV